MVNEVLTMHSRNLSKLDHQCSYKMLQITSVCYPHSEKVERRGSLADIQAKVLIQA